MTKAGKIRIGIISTLMIALLLIPIIGMAVSQSAAAAQPAITVGVGAAGDTTQTKKGAHLLEWGVFGIALGEFAGILGMGISKGRAKKVEKNRQALIAEAQPQPRRGFAPLGSEAAPPAA